MSGYRICQAEELKVVKSFKSPLVESIAVESLWRGHRKKRVEQSALLSDVADTVLHGPYRSL